MGAMPDPVANIKTCDTASGPTLSIRNPGPSTGLASTSVPERQIHSVEVSVKRQTPQTHPDRVLQKPLTTFLPASLLQAKLTVKA